MAYLREGIAWIPEYSLRILDDDTAELTLRGTLLNEAEDLIHCDVNFVVGVPHFVHDKYLAPIAVGQVIRTLGAAVAPPEVQTQIMNRAAISNTAHSTQFSIRLEPGQVDGTPGRRGIEIARRHARQSAAARHRRRRRLHRLYQEGPHRSPRRAGDRHAVRQEDPLRAISIAGRRPSPCSTCSC